MSPPELPSGMTQRSKRGGMRNTFQSTVMGTAVFVAEMQRKVPLRTKLAVLALVLVIGGGATFVIQRQRARTAAEERLAAALVQPAAEAGPTLRDLVTGGDLDDAGRLRAIARLGELRDATAVPALVDALGATDEVRVAAANALARIGAPGAEPARARLAELMHDGASTNPLPYAWALAALGDAEAAELVVEAIPSGQAQALPGYDSGTLARALGGTRLIPRLDHADPRVRQFAASSLGPLCDAGAVAALSSHVGDADQNARQAVLVSLGRCGTGDALAALDGALDANRALWPSLQVAFLNEVGAKAMGVLVARESDPAARAAMLTALAAIADPRAGDALVQELERRGDEDWRVRLQIGAALAEVSDPRLLLVLEPVLGGDGDWPRSAIEILGRTGSPGDVEETLVGIANDRAPLRPAAIAALAEAGACGDGARAVLRRYASTIPEALRGLGRCNDAEALAVARRRVAGALPARGGTRAEDGAAWRAALEVVARFRASDLAPHLLELATDANADPVLRADAGAVLGIVGDDANLDAAADRVMDARTPTAVRQSLLRALRRRTPAAALGRLMGYVRGGEDDERTRAAVVVVGEQAGPELRAELVSLLADERARNGAALALALGGDDASAAALSAAITADSALASRLNQQLTELTWEVDAQRIVPHVAYALTLRDLNFGLPFDRYALALRGATGGPGTPTAREIRRLLEIRCGDPDASVRRTVAAALLGLNARGVLLALRDAGGAGAAEAAELLTPHAGH